MPDTSKKFGPSGLDVSGKRRVQVEPHSDFYLGTGDFTIDCWAWARDPAYFFPFSWWFDANNYFALSMYAYRGNTARLVVRYRVGGVDLIDLDTVTYYDIGSMLTHLAIVRIGLTTTLYVQGVQAAQHVATTAIAVDLSGMTLRLGVGVDVRKHSLHSFDGVIDEFRVHRAGYWSAPFTPPTAEYRKASILIMSAQSRIRRVATVSVSPVAGLALRQFRQLLPTADVLRSTMAAVIPVASRLRATVNALLTTAAGLGLKRGRASIVPKSRVRATFADSTVNPSRIHSLVVKVSIPAVAGLWEQMRASIPAVSLYMTRFDVRLPAVARVENTGLVLYELYHGLDASPDFDAAPLQTSATLPMTTAPVSGEGVHNFVIRQRDKYNNISGNVAETQFELDAGDNLIVVAPSAPLDIDAFFGPDRTADEVTIRSRYIPGVDGSLAADEWVVYWESKVLAPGSNWPDDPGDLPTISYVPMVQVDGIVRLDTVVTAPLVGIAMQVAVRTRRSGDLRASAAYKRQTLTEITLAGPVNPITV